MREPLCCALWLASLAAAARVAYVDRSWRDARLLSQAISQAVGQGLGWLSLTGSANRLVELHWLSSFSYTLD